jgi:hypothetical protein
MVKSFMMKFAPKLHLTLALILGIFLVESVSAQTNEKSDTSYFKEHVSFNGYVKDLRVLVIDEVGNTSSQAWFHNRMNFRYDINTKFTAKLQLRNRLFYGEILQNAPTLGQSLDVDPGSIDMAFNVIDRSSVVLNTFVDRLWLNYSTDKWDISLGRQRINWGQNIVWNPNDLFNVLNYADFDYEERPGSDALRVQRYLKNMSQVEFAYKHADSLEGMVIASMYRFNKKTYDIQIIGGKYFQDIALGLGWAGNLKNASFKGEMTYFEPIDTGNSTYIASVSIDGSIPGNWYITVSSLFNSQGTNDLNLLSSLTTNSNALSVKTLMPNKYSLFLSGAKQLGDLVSLNVAGIYAVDLNGLFLMPSLSYSIRDDLDLSLVGQSYFVKAGSISNPINSIFLRFKWSH